VGVCTDFAGEKVVGKGTANSWDFLTDDFVGDLDGDGSEDLGDADARTRVREDDLGAAWSRGTSAIGIFGIGLTPA
jgi:hypothetical protein